MISSRVHGVIDYIVGIVLILAPIVLGFADGSAAQWVPQILGILVLLMSLLTAYEYSIAKLIPYRVHLVVDIVESVILIISPWVFGFAGKIWWPHVLVGVIELIVIALSWRGAYGDADMRTASPPRM
jgi:hypothetical protein